MVTFADILAEVRVRALPNVHVLVRDAFEAEKQSIVGAVAGDGRVWTHHAEERDRIGDLVAIVSSMESGDVLFVDEFDRWPRQIQDALLDIITRHIIEVTVGRHTLPINLPEIRCVAASCKSVSVPQRLREAFSLHIDCVLPAIETVEELLNRERTEKRAKRLKDRNR